VGAAIVIRGFQTPNATFAIAGIACVLAAAPARAAALLAASAIASAMRTDDMAEMGDAWARMRTSASALLLAGVVLALSPLGALAFGVSSRAGVGLALGRRRAARLDRRPPGLSGPLPPGRCAAGALFEPDRVREAARASLGWPFLLVVGGGALLVASQIRGWLDFLDGNKHPDPLQCIRHLVGGRADRVRSRDGRLYTDKDGALRASELGGVWLRRLSYAGSRNFDRFIVAPVTLIALRIGERWLPAGDGRVVSALDATGRLVVAGARLPVVPVAIAIAVISHGGRGIGFPRGVAVILLTIAAASPSPAPTVPGAGIFTSPLLLSLLIWVPVAAAIAVAILPNPLGAVTRFPPATPTTARRAPPLARPPAPVPPSSPPPSSA